MVMHGNDRLASDPVGDSNCVFVFTQRGKRRNKQQREAEIAAGHRSPAFHRMQVQSEKGSSRLHIAFIPALLSKRRVNAGTAALIIPEAGSVCT
jgi:hypothetical protein